MGGGHPRYGFPCRTHDRLGQLGVSQGTSRIPQPRAASVGACCAAVSERLTDLQDARLRSGQSGSATGSAWRARLKLKPEARSCSR